MYFITGCYREVFKMVESCVSEELTPEELQIFSQLEFLGNDYHPDAHACRLKLSVVTIGLGEGMRCPCKRFDILKFMKQQPDQGNEAMEAVVRIVTSVGNRLTSDSLKMRRWKSIPHPTCYGRFVPDTKDEKLRDGTYRIPRSGQTFEQWMLQITTKAIGIEVNVQLSDVTLQNHQMRLLDPSVIEHSDFSDTRKYHLNNATDVACAEVMHTSNRYWWRLVGRRHDVESWAPDRRNYFELKSFLSAKFTHKFPNHIRKGETWLLEALEAKLPLILPDVTLYMCPDDVSSSSFVHLAGLIENPKTQSTYSTHTLKEVFVWQQPPLIINGRRMFRVLEYTSNMSRLNLSDTIFVFSFR